MLQHNSPSAARAPLSSHASSLHRILPGQAVAFRVHSGAAARAHPPTDLLWTNDGVWNNHRDRATLLDPTGAPISTYTYGLCH